MPNFDAVLDYCRRSANPVGRLLLALYRAQSPADLEASDAICTGLQLTNFWQDIAIDWQKNRVYLPQDDLRRFGVTEPQIAEGRVDAAWRSLLAFEVARARGMLESGRPLTRALPWRLGLELSAIISGGLRILERIDAVDGDIFTRRPVLATRDWLVVAWRAARPGEGGRGMTPDRVLPAEGGGQRLELLLQLHVPAAAAPARDHGALRVLPRSGRRRRRDQRSRRGPRQACVVAARSRADLRRPADASGRHRAAGHRRREFNLTEAHLQEVIDGMAMDLAQHRYLDFAALELYCHRVAGVVGLMSAEIFGYVGSGDHWATRATWALRSS